MNNKDNSCFNLTNTFIHLTNSGKAHELVVDADFWGEISSREDLQNGRLMGSLDIPKGSSHWEMHPEGDEFLYLLSGSIDVELEEQNEKRTITLSVLTGCIIPCGVWHRTVVHQPGKMIFITPGKGTQHR